MPKKATPPGPVHGRIIAAVRADHRSPSEWARRLGMRANTMNHRLTGRTPWTLDEALEIAQRLGTTVDDLASGRFTVTPTAPTTGRGVTRPHGRTTR